MNQPHTTAQIHPVSPAGLSLDAQSGKAADRNSGSHRGNYHAGHRLSTDTSTARQSALIAGRARSRALLMVTTGQMTAFDVILDAMGPDGGPLRRIRLDQLVLAQPNVGRVRATAFLSEVAARLDDTTQDISSKDILWLTVPRAGAKRFFAWMDTAQASGPRTLPWPGFPLAPRPQGSTTTNAAGTTTMTKDR